MELLVTLLVGLFFFALITGNWLKNAPLPVFSDSPRLDYDDGSRFQMEEFKWGKLWVFDNDRSRSRSERPLVLIHGLGSSIFSWRYQLASFPPDYPVIAMDLAGFGRSDKPREDAYDLDSHTQKILDVLDSKKVQECYVLGCSLGGAIALWLCQLDPQRFCKALVISPAATPTLVPLPYFPHDQLWPVMERIMSRHVVRRALKKGLARHERLSEEVIENYLAPFKTPGSALGFLRSIRAIKDQRVFAGLKHLNVDVLILWGDRDRVVRRSFIQRIAHQNKRFVLRECPGGGHHLMEDEPEWVNSQISTFFNLRNAAD